MICLFLKNPRCCPHLRGKWAVAKLTTKAQLKATRHKRIEDEFKEGAELEGFLVNRVTDVVEFNMKVVGLRHVKTGCDYLHLARDDKNKVFSVGFRTTPLNSTGVSHVLEHSVLCGSTKYPIRDPFVKMMGRSTANSMNALTGPDYTLYTFATRYWSDYENLVSVFMDSVFKPRLRELDFLREGWRLEHGTPQNRDTPVVVRGTVYHEMKSLLSDNNALFSNALLNNLLPSHTYAVVSGGDPKFITNLSYEELKTFHKKFYHPSNCRIYSYGDLPLLKILRYVNSEYLADYQDTSDYAKATKVPPEPRWDSERRKHVSCRPHPLEAKTKKQSTIAIATLCNDVQSSQETFTMQIISDLLANSRQSAFYKSMIETNLGKAFAPTTGYDWQTRDTFFSVGLSGVDSNDFDKVIEAYHKTLDGVSEKGFDEDYINATLQAVELSTKHQTANFGMEMLFQLMPTWNHDGDVIKAMKINDKVAAFKQSMADNASFLQDAVKEHLVDNQHRLILTMSPDEDFDAIELQQEKECVERQMTALSISAQDIIFEKTAELARDQETTSDLRVLPTFSTSLLEEDVERVLLKGYKVQEIPVQVCNFETNGVTYIRGVLNASILSEETKSLLPLFCIAATKMGVKGKDYKTVERLIRLKTGRFSLSPHVAENIYNNLSYEEGVTFSSICLDRNADSMVALWEDIFTGVEFKDVNRFRQIVQETALGVSQNVTTSGGLYAISVASAAISPPAERKEQFAGLEFMKKMKELSVKVNLSGVLETMAGIKEVVLNKRVIRIAVNTSCEMEEKLLTSIDTFLKAAPGEFQKSYSIFNPQVNAEEVNSNIFVEVPSNSSFTAHCTRTVEYTHQDFPLLRLAASLLTIKYCLPLIKCKGSASNAAATISTSGVFSFFSTRDRNPARSLELFNDAKQWLESDKEYTQNDVEEAKLVVFRSIDAPLPPGSRGVRNFLFGISDDELQKQRSIIRAAKKEDIMRVASCLNGKCVARCLIGPTKADVCSKIGDNWQTRFVD